MLPAFIFYKWIILLISFMSLGYCFLKIPFCFQDFRGKGNKKYSCSLGSAKGSNTTICSTGSTAPTKPAPPPPTTKPPLIAKWKPGAKLLGQSESDGKY